MDLLFYHQSPANKWPQIKQNLTVGGRDEVKENALMTSGLYITFCPLFWHQISQDIYSVQDQHIHLLLSTSCCFLWPSPMPFFWMFGIISWHLVKYHPTFFAQNNLLNLRNLGSILAAHPKLLFTVSDWSIYNSLAFILILLGLSTSFGIEMLPQSHWDPHLVHCRSSLACCKCHEKIQLHLWDLNLHLITSLLFRF